MALLSIQRNLVIRYINSWTSSWYSTTPDGFPACVFKVIDFSHSSSIVKAVLSMDCRCIPSGYKLAIVCPISKKVAINCL